MIQKRGVGEGRSAYCPSHLAHHPQQQQLPHPRLHPYMYTAAPSIKIPPKWVLTTGRAPQIHEDYRYLWSSLLRPGHEEGGGWRELVGLGMVYS